MPQPPQLSFCRRSVQLWPSQQAWLGNSQQLLPQATSPSSELQHRPASLQNPVRCRQSVPGRHRWGGRGGRGGRGSRASAADTSSSAQIVNTIAIDPKRRRRTMARSFPWLITPMGGLGRSWGGESLGGHSAAKHGKEQEVCVPRRRVQRSWSRLHRRIEELGKEVEQSAK